jgi:dTDP-4-dehydrorhamnose 3,5-epimerase-like enzyme
LLLRQNTENVVTYRRIETTTKGDVMADWTMAQAKRDFEIGYLTGFHFEREPMGTAWNVRLSGGSARGCLVDDRDKSPRAFKSLDSALSAVEQIGFKVIALSNGA